MIKTSRLVVASIAAAIACGHAGAAMAAKDEAVVEPRLQLGKKFRAAIAPAQAALAARDYPRARAALGDARPHIEIADEQYVYDQIDLTVAQATGDRPATIAALDRLIASGEAAKQLTAADKARYYANQGEFLFQANHWARAEKAFAASIAAGNRDPQIALFLAESQLRGGRPADAVRNIRAAIDASNAAGRKAIPDWYARGAEIAARAKLSKEYVEISTAWLAAYPDRETWYVALAGYRQLGGLSTDVDRELMRLARLSGSTLFSLKDYVDFTNLVSSVSANEAVTLLREGISAGKISQSENPVISKLLTKVDPRLAAEKKKFAGKPAGSSYAALSAHADGLYGLKEFARAADVYRQALTASGADIAQGNLRLAAALAQSGDKVGALAALDKVAGNYAPLAAYWRTWVENPVT